MMISTKGRYALRTMIDIAQNEHSASTPVSIQSISNRQGISVKYLEQIISMLLKSGLLRSIRGAKGGYVLTVPVSDIKIGDILRATEGSLAPVECLTDSAKDCPRRNACSTLPIYKEIDEAVTAIIDRYTLADLCHTEASAEP